MRSAVTLNDMVTIMNIMPNNLNEMIKRAGLQKKLVAERKGVTPETLSRHIHERVPMTSVDAQEYADILDCFPQQILYPHEPITIIGRCHLVHDDKSENNFCEDDATGGYIYMNAYHAIDTAAIIYSAEKDYTGFFQDLQNAIEVIDWAPVREKYVCKDSFQRSSWVKLKEPQQIHGNMKQITKDKKLVLD